MADLPDLDRGLTPIDVGPIDVGSVGDRIEVLLDQLRVKAEPRVYETAEEVLRLVTELYGEGLARIMDVVQQAAPQLVERLTEDELVASLLVVHDLHPDDLAARVAGALDSVRPYLGDHGGDVQLLGIDAEIGAVHLRLLGSCDGCPSSATTLRMAVERAIVEAAPEVVLIDVEQPLNPAVGTRIELGPKPVVVS